MATVSVIHEIGDFGYPEKLVDKDKQKLAEQALNPGEAERIEARARMYETM